VARREDVLCPAGAWRDGILEQPLWRTRLQHMQVEYDIYGLAVARWNQHVEMTTRPERISHLVYYAYLMNFYERLAPIRAQLGEQGWQALSAEWAQHCLNGVSVFSEAGPRLESYPEVVPALYDIARSFFQKDYADR
jgi:hypothetical protein